MNKHGFKGVRKRTDGRARPYYARVTVKGQYIYLPSHDTAEAAAREFEALRPPLPNNRTGLTTNTNGNCPP